MIADNVEKVRKSIALACERAGRSPDAITLVAVTKTFDATVIKEVVGAGVLDIGENFVQEMTRKREEIHDERIRWHYIGHLQRNKVKAIAGWIHLVHSVDSRKLTDELSTHGAQIDRSIRIMVEVNTSGEGTKFGISPEETLMFVKELTQISNITVTGLMTVGPFLPNPEDSRPAFRSLRLIQERLQEDGINLPCLSMGMSNDFEVAIEEGATHVRIGTAMFGKRVKA